MLFAERVRSSSPHTPLQDRFKRVNSTPHFLDTRNIEHLVQKYVIQDKPADFSGGN